MKKYIFYLTLSFLIATSVSARKTGELVHEVTKDIKSDNFEKDISFYKCS